MAADEGDGLVLTREGHRHQIVLHVVGAGAVMALANAHQPVAAGDMTGIGVSPRPRLGRWGSQGLRFASGGDRPQALVGEVAEHDGVGADHGVRGPPVLVDGGAGGEPPRDVVGDHAVAVGADHHLEAAVVRAALHPPHPARRHRQVAQAQ